MKMVFKFKKMQSCEVLLYLCRNWLETYVEGWVMGVGRHASLVVLVMGTRMGTRLLIWTR